MWLVIDAPGLLYIYMHNKDSGGLRRLALNRPRMQKVTGFGPQPAETGDSYRVWPPTCPLRPVGPPVGPDLATVTGFGPRLVRLESFLT